MVEFKAQFLSENDTFDVEFENTDVVEVVTSDHNKLINRDMIDQHPISSIIGLEDKLNNKLESIPAMTNEDIENILKGFIE